MRKKLLALMMSFVLVLSLCPAALAAEEDDVHETHFFTDANADRRTDMTFDELSAYLLDWYDNEFDYWEEMIPLAHELLVLAEDEANAEEVKAMLLELDETYIQCRAAYQAACIIYYLTGDVDYYYNYYDGYYYLWYLMGGVCGKILASPCASVAEELVTDDFDRQDYADWADYYLDYAYYTYYYPAEDAGDAEEAEEAETDEEDSDAVDPYTADEDLINEYYGLMYEEYTVTYEGKEWTENDLYDALLAEEIDNDTYTQLVREIGKNRNAVWGGLFLEMLPYRQQIAEDYGYSDYMENCYDYIYERDFTYEEIQTYADALKTYMVPLYNASEAVDVDYGDAFLADYAGDLGMDLIQPYVAKISSELLESFTYMREHGMVDSDWSDTKTLGGTNFTTAIYGYGTGFILADPAIAYANNQIYNFDMIVHEYGHYNNDYWSDLSGSFFSSEKTIDVMEVHSQALELLMTEFYPEIFGDEAESVTFNRLTGILYTLLYEAQCNEFETYAYTTPGVTLQQLNEKWLQLGIEYGFVSPDTPYTENYNWVTNPQLFASPGYSISYSVSLAGSCIFWLDSLKDYYTGVDEYLQFCALPNDLAFQESFESMGLDNPLSPDFIQALAGEMAAVLDLEEEPVSFTDVEGRWFAEAVLALANEGLVSGYEDGTFRPDEPATRGMIDPDAADAALTRLEACQLLAEGLDLPDGAASPFSDTDDAAVAALAALGVVGGYADGTFRPDEPMTRAELCAAWYRLLNA